MGRCSLLAVAIAIFVAGCAPRPLPPDPPPAHAAPPSPEARAVPGILVEADGTVRIDGEAVSGPDQAVERLRPSFDDGAELAIVDRSGGGTAVMTLVAALREAGAERIVVQFDDPLEASSSPDGRTASEGPPPPPPNVGSLPEVQVEHVGLHIGGGPNDDASRAPYLATMAQRFGDLRGCYRLVNEPEKGGVFGVDLFIPRQGGKPEVRAQRTGMGGPQFRECVAGVFASVEFDEPARGPTVISYSVRFGLDD